MPATRLQLPNPIPHLHLGLEHVAWRQGVAVLAILAPIWAHPEPAILTLLHSLQEVLADDVCTVVGLHTSRAS